MVDHAWATVETLTPLTVTTRDGVTRDAVMINALSLDIGSRVRVELPRVGPVLVYGIDAAPAPVDTGWVTLTLQSGFTATQPVQARRMGLLVYMRGVATPTTNWGAANASNTIVASGGIPADMRPGSQWVAVQSAPSDAGTPVLFRVTPQASGAIVVAPSAGSVTAGVAFGGVSWPVG